MCSVDNILDCVGIEAPDVTEMISGGIAQSLDELVQKATDGLNQVSAIVMTWWMETPSPTVSECGKLTGVNRETGAAQVSPDCGEPTGVIALVADHTVWIVGFIAVLSLVIAATKIALTRDGKAAREAAGGLVGLLAGSTIVLGALQILIGVGDAYSSWIIEEAATGEDPTSFFLDGVNAADNTLSALLMLSVVTSAMLLGIVQFILLLARFAGLVFLSGLVPVAFAVGMTGGGRAMRDKYLAWMVAFTLYKPVAATIWATVIWMMRSTTVFTMDALQAFINYLVMTMMIILSLLALPAMMRLVAPAVATVGGGGGGGLFAAVAGGASVASGAVDVGVRRRSESTSASQTTRGPDAGGAQTAGATAPQAAGAGAKGGQAAGAAAKGGKAAASAGAGAATAGVATGVQVGVEAAKAGGKAAQGLGEHAGGNNPTGAQGGTQ